jgi:hypothetical protein
MTFLGRESPYAHDPNRDTGRSPMHKVLALLSLDGAGERPDEFVTDAGDAIENRRKASR